MRPGFFYSVHFNYHRHVCGFTVSKPGPGRGTQHDFDVFAAAQLTELAGYGPEMLWLDGVMDSSKLPLVKQAVATHLSGVACHSCVDSHGNDPAVLPMANKNDVRWTSSGEEAIAPYPLWAANNRCDQATAALPGSRTGSDFCVPSADTVLREHDWYWHKDNATRKPPKSTSVLLNQYLTSVGHGATMVVALWTTEVWCLPPMSVPTPRSDRPSLR